MQYIWFHGEKIPVSEDVLRKYRRFVWSERKKHERAMRCIDERGVRCTKDCKTCEQPLDDTIYSLEKMSEDGFDLADTSDDILAYTLLLDALRTAVARLTERERGMIVARFFQNKTEREVAQSFGISQPRVNKHIKKILEKLKNMLS